MSGEGEEQDDKQYEASPKKLEDARRKGEVPRSTDLITTGSYAGLFIVGASVGAASLQDFATGLTSAIEQVSSPESVALIANGLLAHSLLSLAPWGLVPPALALLSVVAQRGFTITPDKLKMKGNRVSILSNAKNKFGRGGLFEFGKSVAKLTIFSVILLWYLSKQMPHVMATIALSPSAMVATMFDLTLRFMALILLVSLTIGCVDYFWQRAEHLRKNRMSRKDMTDEQKQSEGDPMMKQQRRQRGYDIATNSMLADVPDAAVVLVNPTHYAVALKWDRSSSSAPICVAKGVDQIAARIREAADGAGVPIHSDPPTTRALHASVELGKEIDPEFYAPIAVAIRFAEDMRRKAAGR